MLSTLNYLRRTEHPDSVQLYERTLIPGSALRNLGTSAPWDNRPRLTNESSFWKMYQDGMHPAHDVVTCGLLTKVRSTTSAQLSGKD